MYKDKAFVATSNGIVHGVNKLGKEFYNMTSTITETTHYMDVRVPQLWLSGEYLCLSYIEDSQTNYYSSREKINCLTSQTILNKGEYSAVIGCQDRMVRILDKNDSGADILVEGAVTAVAPYSLSNRNEILYATENGTLGSLGIHEGSSYFGWKTSDSSFVTTIDTYDYTQDGTLDILVGRDNGAVNILSQTSNGLQKIFDRNLNESITSVRVGSIVNQTSQDIVLSTFSGKVSVFSSEDPEEQVPSVKQSKKFNIKDSVKKRFSKPKEPVAAPNTNLNTKEKRIDSLQKDIKKLEEKLSSMKSKYSKISEEMIAVHCKYSAKSKFILDSSMASYRMTVELDIPIDLVSLCCNTPIDILNSDTKGVVIASTKEKNPKDGMTVKSTIRCTQDSNRVEILIRTVEGQFGQVEVYIIPKLTPKTSQMISFPIKPLSLHERLHKTDLPPNLNILTVEGQFSLEEIHGWIGLCLEGIPDRVIDDEVEYFFQSTFQNTILSIKLKRGEAIFSSNNVTTLSILDEMISKLATDRKSRVQTNFKVNESTFEDVLRLLYPKLEYQFQLSEKVKRVESLKEIQMQEEDISFLTEEYKQILENEKKLRSELQNQTQRLDFLSAILFRLLEDKFKYKRQNSQKYVNQLQDLLSGKSFTLEQLLAIFRA